MSAFAYAYGAVVIVGGLIGYIKSNSIASLAAGGGSGAIFVALEAFGGGSQLATGGQIAVSGILTYVMGSRYLEKGAFMPAGLVAFLSAAAFVLSGSRFFGGGKSRMA